MNENTKCLLCGIVNARTADIYYGRSGTRGAADTLLDLVEHCGPEWAFEMLEKLQTEEEDAVVTMRRAAALAAGRRGALRECVQTPSFAYAAKLGGDGSGQSGTFVQPGKPGNPAKRFAGIIKAVLDQTQGNRNACLYWGGCAMADMIADKECTAEQATDALVQAAAAIGLGHSEAASTIRSAYRRKGI